MASGETKSGTAEMAPEAAETFGGYVGDFFALMKLRVMSLVVFTALVGMVTAPGGIHPVLGAIAILAIAIGAGNGCVCGANAGAPNGEGANVAAAPIDPPPTSGALS